jgi:ABC-type lipoprotein export system ATPase subunit
MYELNGISKVYVTGKTHVNALNNLSIKIHKGTIVAIVGKSGCGKSTLLNILGGMDQPSSGTLLYEGIDLSRFNSPKLATYRRTEVGIVFQSFNLIPPFNAWENVAMALAIGNVARSKRKKMAIDLLEKVGLANRSGHLPSELSGGECQRVSIARALANNPKVILADEPTGNLDSVTSKQIMDLLKALNLEFRKTIVMVTHELDYAHNYSDEILTLHDGKILN